MAKQKPVDLDLTWDQVSLLAKDSLDRFIKKRLFDTFGWRPYQSWFHFNNVHFKRLKNGLPDYEVKSDFVRNKIEHSFYDFIVKAYKTYEANQ